MSFIKKAKSLALALATIAAPVGVAAASVATAVSPQVGLAEPAELSARKVDAVTPLMIVGPGVHRYLQRPLTGLEIRAVRTASRCIGTERSRHLRSKYRNLPEGPSCAMRKQAKRAASLLVGAAQAQGLV